jgi:hypothetical protein
MVLTNSAANGFSQLNHVVECDQQMQLYHFLLLLNSLYYIVVEYLLTLSQYYHAIFLLLAKEIMNCLGLSHFRFNTFSLFT